MKRSSIWLPNVLAFAFVAATFGCSSGGDGGGKGGSAGGSTGTAGSGGSSGATGTAGNGGATGTAGNGGATGTAGNGGTAGNASTAGSGGATAGAGGGNAGRGGNAGGGGNATGGTPGSAGTTPPIGGRGGNGGTAGGTGGGNAGRGGNGGGNAGRGGSAGGGTAGAGGTSGGITLTSTALTQGGRFPAANTCAGANDSLPLSWTAGPSGTMSYAVILTDMNNSLNHYAIWDIPATTTSLPAALMKTFMPIASDPTKQVSFMNNVKGYYGPCPNGMDHTYQFVVYALDVATLPGLSMTSTPATVSTQVMMHDLASGSLSGISNAMM